MDPEKDRLGKSDSADPSAMLSPEQVKQLVVSLLEDDLAVSIAVTGSSMSPSVRSHDQVVIEPLGETVVRCGDIVAFLGRGNQLILHRIVARKGPDFLTRGDAGAPGDQWVQRSAILGRVVAIRRAGRSIRLGLGPERRLLAWLSFRGWLRPVLALGIALRRIRRRD